MHVWTTSAPPFYKNGFVVACERTRQGVVIDPGDDVEDQLAIVRREGIAVTMILLTHAHLDHITGVAAARTALGSARQRVDVWLHRDDLFLYERAVDQGHMFGMDVQPQPYPDRFYSEGESLTFGNYVVDITHTPGHCPGGVCLAIGRAGEAGKERRELFVGDTLFAGSIGRTDLPGGDLDTLLSSIRNELFVYPDATVVHSGHGPDTTIGAERRSNPFLI